MYQLLIFLLYIFLDKDCKIKVSTHGQLVPIFYFTRPLDRKRTTFYKWSYLTLPLALGNFTHFSRAFSGDIYWNRNLCSVRRNVRKIHKYISCLYNLIASFTSITYLLITGKIMNSPFSFPLHFYKSLADWYFSGSLTLVE